MKTSPWKLKPNFPFSITAAYFRQISNLCPLQKFNVRGDLLMPALNLVVCVIIEIIASRQV